MKILMMLNSFVYLLLFPVVSLAATPPLEPNAGEFYLRELRSRMAIELHQIYSQPGLLKEENYLLQDFLELATFMPEFIFLPGSDPRFQLHPNEPKRTAVTTTEKRSPIYFNLDLIKKNFHLSDAMRLIIHELGHKVHPDIKKVIPDYSFVVDRFAAKIANVRMGPDLRESHQNFTIHVHGSYPEEKPNLYDHPSERFDQEIWPMIYVETKQGVRNLSPILFASYQKINADANDNRIFAALVVRDWEISRNRVSFHLSYRLHKKNELTRYLNRYLEQIEFSMDSNGDIKFADAIPDYPLISLAHKIELIKEPQGVRLKLQFLEYWYGDVSKAKVLLLADGKKMLLEAADFSHQDITVEFFFPKSLGKKIEILGFQIFYSKHPGDRDPNDGNYFPYDNYFLPVQEQLEFSLR